MLPRIAGSSGPKVFDINTWDIAIDIPESKVRRNTPFNPLMPPPVRITSTKGIVKVGSISWNAISDETMLTSKLVAWAKDVIGIPTDP